MIIDYQLCVQCEHWQVCRWVLDSAERGAKEGDDNARRQAGTSAPIRGFLPVCPVRDERRRK